MVQSSILASHEKEQKNPGGTQAYYNHSRYIAAYIGKYWARHTILRWNSFARILAFCNRLQYNQWGKSRCLNLYNCLKMIESPCWIVHLGIQIRGYSKHITAKFIYKVKISCRFQFARNGLIPKHVYGVQIMCTWFALSLKRYHTVLKVVII